MFHKYCPSPSLPPPSFLLSSYQWMKSTPLPPPSPAQQWMLINGNLRQSKKKKREEKDLSERERELKKPTKWRHYPAIPAVVLIDCGRLGSAAGGRLTWFEPAGRHRILTDDNVAAKWVIRRRGMRCHGNGRFLLQSSNSLNRHASANSAAHRPLPHLHLEGIRLRVPPPVAWFGVAEPCPCWFASSVSGDVWEWDSIDPMSFHGLDESVNHILVGLIQFEMITGEI